MRITAISDLHGYLPRDLSGGEVLCICGDIVPLEYQRDLVQSVAWFALDFDRWASSLPYGKVLFLGGNHDFFLHEIGEKHRPSSVMKHLLPGSHKGQSKLVYLCDNSVEIDGIRFYGTPWIGDLSNWAFFKPDDELRRIYNKIPWKCDVLMTHMPPLACDAGTVLQRGCYNTGANYGSAALSEAIAARDINYALCGHVHTGNHHPETYCGVKIVNVSLKDEDYRVAYKPFTFEV